MTEYVDFEIVKCVNAAPCAQRCLLVTLPGSDAAVRLTGTCDGPHHRVKVYRVRRDQLLQAIGAADSNINLFHQGGA